MGKIQGRKLTIGLDARKHPVTMKSVRLWIQEAYYAGYHDRDSNKHPNAKPIQHMFCKQ